MLSDPNLSDDALEQAEQKPRWARRKDARPGELLAAALDVFVDHGFAATKLDDVAKRAGVSKGTLYLYFKNKEDLFKEVVRNTIVPNIEVAEKLVADFQGDTADLFKEMIVNWHKQISGLKMAGICKLMFAEASNFPELSQFYYTEVIQRNELMMIRLLQRGMERGEFRQLDLTVMPKIICAPMVMLMLWSTSFGATGPQIPTDNYISAYVESTLSGLLKK
jgi:AcrR family transcriptional regulator